mgnify:CR=1 FL=1
MKQKIRTILNDLENMRENLLSLSDDIWLDIDHNDSEALREGAEFKLAYNEKMADFGKVADDLSDLIQQFAGLDLEGEGKRGPGAPSAFFGQEEDPSGRSGLPGRTSGCRFASVVRILFGQRTT